MSEDMQFAGAVVAIIVSIGITIGGAGYIFIHERNTHSEAMAKLGYCQVMVAGSSSPVYQPCPVPGYVKE